MSEQILIGLVAIAVLVYMVVRQFQAKRVRFPQILILPALVAWYTYTNIAAEIAREHTSIALMLGLFVLGLIPGLALGGYRSLLYRLRIDDASGVVLAQKAGVFSIVVWFILLAFKIGAATLTYTTPGNMTFTIFLLTTLVHGLFIGNIVGENLGLWLRASNYQNTHISSQIMK